MAGSGRDLSRSERKAERKAERRAKRDELVAEMELKRELKDQGLLAIGASQRIVEGGRPGKVTFEVQGLRVEAAKAAEDHYRGLVPYRSVQTVTLARSSSERGLFGRERLRDLGRVELALANSDIEWQMGAGAERFVNTLNAILTGAHPGLAAPAMDLSLPAEAAPPADPRAPRQPDVESASGVANDLVKLADLHRQGMLSDDEFAAAKAKLLA